VRLSGEKPKDKVYPKAVKTIGDAIRTRRLDLGLKQRDVAAIIGCDKTSVVNWEKGHNTPAKNKMSGIRRFLGVH
jgi:transcriptional regulator with XRE-family HTH domain